jgi:hypothetical protein
MATRYAGAGSVLLGRVTGVRGLALDQTATLTIIRSWKGPHHAGESVETETPPCGGLSCSHLVRTDDVVLVFSPAAGQVDLYQCSVFTGDEVNPIVALLDAGQWRTPLQCMAQVLKKTRNVDEVESGVLKTNGHSQPFVQYRYREEDGELGKVTFIAQNFGALKVPTYFTAFLSGLVPPGMTKPRAFGTIEIMSQWRAQCAVGANVIWP